jgi:hypothetical protein
MATAAAATKNKKQKTRRLLDDVNVNLGLEYMFIKWFGLTSIDWNLRTRVNTIFNVLEDKPRKQIRIRPQAITNRGGNVAYASRLRSD